MIIIDDCSIDNTFEIARRYAKKDKRIKLIRHKKNWGIPKLSNTYNQALSMSSGKYIAVLEGDDLWPKYKLEKQIEDFSDDGVVLSYGDSVTISSKGNPFKIVYYKNKPNSWLSNNPVGSILYAFMDLNFSFEPQTVIIRKETLLKIKGFKKHNVFPFVDYPTWFYLSLEGKFSYFRGIAGYYRKHSGSEWFNFSLKTKARVRYEVQKCMLDFIADHKKQLKLLNIKIDKKKVISEQRKTLQDKEKKGNLSILFHYIVFEDRNMQNEIITKILKGTGNNVRAKVIALIILFTQPIQTHLIYIQFRIRLLYYKLFHLTK